MKKIIIIDDHNIVRTGLKVLITEIEGYVVVGEGINGEELFTILSNNNPDLIILDLNMPVMNGIEVLEELYKQNRKYNILIGSMHNEYKYIQKCIDLGVKGYIFKDESDEEYVKSIIKTANGETYFTPKCLRMLEIASKDLY